MWWEFARRKRQPLEAIWLRGEVNWLIGGRSGECLPAVDLAHVDLVGGEQHPE
jgi:hypothetical protein